MIPSWAHDVKPEKIMRQICKICLSDGRILDPFAGSGSTLAAAEREGYALEMWRSTFYVTKGRIRERAG